MFRKVNMEAMERISELESRGLCYMDLQCMAVRRGNKADEAYFGMKARECFDKAVRIKARHNIG